MGPLFVDEGPSTEKRETRVIADGRVAVVTGGGSGIGEAVAGLLAAAGARVWIADIDDGAAARVAGQVTEAGGVVYGRRVDVAHAESVQVFADEIIASDGRIDVLVNSAGVTEWSRFEDTSNTQWDRMLAVNLTGVFNACRLLGAPMIGQRSGKIINVASTLGIFGSPYLVSYTASKHGVVGLTRALAVEWAKHNIQINCICPGATGTPGWFATSAEYQSDRTRRIPLGRIATAADQARAILFLASRESDYLTGCILPVDGGVVALAPGTSEAAMRGPT